MKWVLALAAGLVVTAAAAQTAPATPATPKVPDYIAAAIADPARIEDAKVDERRHPAALVEFAGIRPGTKVLELIPGGGYFTRIFSKVVGANGKVYAEMPSELTKVDRFKAVADAYANVTMLRNPAAAPTTPELVDVVFTSQNYHDYPNPSFGKTDPALVDRHVFAALKPGGVYIVIDHAAEVGSGLRDTDTLHRIDPAYVRKQVESAGFEYVGESTVLRNPADDHSLKVFDPAIRGHTDQFAYKFRKPVANTSGSPGPTL